MKRLVLLFIAVLAGIIYFETSVLAVEDGLGTNVVRNLRVNDGGTMTLGGVVVTNWLTAPVGTGAVSLVDYLATNAVFAGATGVLDSATGSLNTAVTLLQGATGVLDSATGSLDSAVTLLQGATGVLNSATGTLNTAVSGLNARTNAWNNGVIIKAGSGALTAGNLYYMNGASAWVAANASTNDTAQGLIGLALVSESEPYANGLLLNGQFTKTDHGHTVGAPIYLAATAGGMTNIPPSGTNQIVRIVGYAIDANTIMFNPDRTYIEILGE
ncbi:MAG: hypothetical protein ABIH24_11600 [Verrucomicrobiota bacterium]